MYLDTRLITRIEVGAITDSFMNTWSIAIVLEHVTIGFAVTDVVF